MTRELSWILVVILVGAGLFLAAAIGALWVGIRRLKRLRDLTASQQHAKHRHRQAAQPSPVAALGAAGAPLKMPADGQSPWYIALILALLAILGAWAAVWVLEVSGVLDRFSLVDQNGVSFYWQSLALPAVMLGAVVLIQARADRRRALQFNAPGKTGSQDAESQAANPLAPAQARTLSAPLLFTGAVSGLGLWLVAMFFQRILAAWIPAGFGGASVFILSPVVQWVDPFKVGLLGSVPAPGGAAGAWLLILLVVLVSPLVAEWFFRGYVLPAWAARWGWTGGWVGSALLFAVFSLNILGLPAMFVAGLGLGWLARYGWSRSLPAEAALAGAPQGIAQAASGFMPAPLQGAWLAHTVFNLLMVMVWLWH